MKIPQDCIPYSNTVCISELSLKTYLKILDIEKEECLRTVDDIETHSKNVLHTK